MLGSLAAACSSSTKRVILNPVVPTSTASPSARDELVFRVVRGILPFDAQISDGSEPSSSSPQTCKGGRLVTPSSKVTADVQVVLPDRRDSNCYLLGPVILTGHNISSAQALQNATDNAWEVNLHFSNNDFVTKVATPYVNQEVAIVFGGVVESAPNINPGITGQDVTISGEFDATEARTLANLFS